jgi:hypothetical protein
VRAARDTAAPHAAAAKAKAAALAEAAKVEAAAASVKASALYEEHLSEKLAPAKASGTDLWKQSEPHRAKARERASEIRCSRSGFRDPFFLFIRESSACVGVFSRASSAE